MSNIFISLMFTFTFFLGSILGLYLGSESPIITEKKIKPELRIKVKGSNLDTTYVYYK